MKKILGLDLGTSSIGWALVHEAENENEQSSIIKLGVRVNPLTVDEFKNFERGNSLTTNSERQEKRSARRNLQRYKNRRSALIDLLTESGWISNQDKLSETGTRTTFETYRLRAKAAVEEIKLSEFARVLLMINKKRGYKSNRKVKTEKEGELIDGMDTAKLLYDKKWTPGQLCLHLLLNENKKKLPDFYRSDLVQEFTSIWNFQKQFYPAILTDQVKEEVIGKSSNQTWTILANYFVWQETNQKQDKESAHSEPIAVECRLTGLKRTTKGIAQKIENYQWRVQALTEKMDLEHLAIVLQNINGEISNSSSYLGAISDRSKELYFNHLTVGQYLMQQLDRDANARLRNQIFYRQDYLDEFETIWEKQASFHQELTPELKQEIRDCIIFYQRGLKSQKHLVAFCEFEQSKKELVVDGKTQVKTIGARVIPRSHPLFQEFRIWQTLNNIVVFSADSPSEKRFLQQDEKAALAEELAIKPALTKKEALKLLFKNHKELDLNFQEIKGNDTGYMLYSAFGKMMEIEGYQPLNFKKKAKEIKEQTIAVFEDKGWNTDILSIDLAQDNKNIEKQPYFRLWHLLYSFEGDNTRTGNGKLIDHLMQLCRIGKEHAMLLSNISFLDDYASLSAKAINKILPFLKEGNQYDVACMYAGYKHSASSLTKEEISNKSLKEHLDVLPRNSLRNPVVEKILNQMVHVVNEIIDHYGRPDEIRVELARELKNNAKERERIFKAIDKNQKENAKIVATLTEQFNILNPSKNDIIRYKLYQELKGNGYKTLYSNQYIPIEKLFSKEIDIEHIIPKARVFDDSLSNKTLEYHQVNLEKSDMTAFDYVQQKHNNEFERYIHCCETLFAKNLTKLRKLKLSADEIGEGFIDRDLRNTQYIAKKALLMLGDICRQVVATTGSITDKLRRDWQLVDVLKELTLPKYEALGEVSTYSDRDGRVIKQINNWSKRNDHRHHAMDALTVAFTKNVYIQYFNHMNAVYLDSEKDYAAITGIKNKYFREGKAIAPISVAAFRASAKYHLENLLVSIKAKNKVVTQNDNRYKCKDKVMHKVQNTPRGQLHDKTIYGSHKKYVVQEEKISSAFTEEKIMTVCRKQYRDALLQRLKMYQGDPKKAFTGKNSLAKNPVYWDENQKFVVPEKVKTVVLEKVYTHRVGIDKDLKIEKVIDTGVRRVLADRLKQYENAEKAFSDLDENPIWLNKDKGICVKRVAIKESSNPTALHSKLDKDGKLMLDENGCKIPVDFVNTANNHHVAIYSKPVVDNKGNQKIDENGNALYEWEDQVVSFYEAVARANARCPIIDKEYRSSEGWKFLFSMKQNEYFIFPNQSTGFDPNKIDLLDPKNYSLISPNLFRVQKFSKKDYMFRHHLETSVQETPILKNIVYKRITSLSNLKGVVKVRLNHIGQIVAIGEY